MTVVALDREVTVTWTAAVPGWAGFPGPGGLQSASNRPKRNKARLEIYIQCLQHNHLPFYNSMSQQTMGPVREA